MPLIRVGDDDGAIHQGPNEDQKTGYGCYGGS
jgi:hypothetical protein